MYDILVALEAGLRRVLFLFPVIIFIFLCGATSLRGDSTTLRGDSTTLRGDSTTRRLFAPGLVALEAGLRRVLFLFLYFSF